MKFQNEEYLWLLLLLILFYILWLLLKKYRKVALVPSIELWEGISSNNFSIFPLFFMFTLIVFSLAGPYTGKKEDKKKLIILLDNSASMLVKEDETRWEIALKKIKKYSNHYKASIFLISPFLKSITMEELKDLKPQLLEMDLREISNISITKEDIILLITDSNNIENNKILLEYKSKYKDNFYYEIIGKKTSNLSIHLVKATKNVDLQVNLEISIINRFDKSVNLDLISEFKGTNGKIEKKIYNLDILANQKILKNIILPLKSGELELKIKKIDAFDLDNTIYINMKSDEKAKIAIVTESPQPYLLSALSSSHNIIDLKNSIVVDNVNPQNLISYDLIILLKKNIDFNLPKSNYLIWGSEGKDIPIIKNFTAKNPILWYIKKNHNLTNFIEPYYFKIEEALIGKPINAKNILFYSNLGPIAWEGNYEDKKYIYLSFDLDKSNFVMLPSFPIFLLNVIHWVKPRKDINQLIQVKQLPESESDIAPKIKKQIKKLPIPTYSKITHWKKKVIILALITIFFIYFFSKYKIKI